MSDETKRLVAIGAAIVITWGVFGFYAAEPWWVAVGFFLLAVMALHAILGVSIVWIDGVDRPCAAIHARSSPER